MSQPAKSAVSLVGRFIRVLPSVKSSHPCCSSFHHVTRGLASYRDEPGEKYTASRALLYVPGSDERKLNKIPKFTIDTVVMDCEDGVALNRKKEARELIKVMLDKLDFSQTNCSVRVNSVSSGLLEEDLKVVLSADRVPQSVMVPKLNNKQEMEILAKRLEAVLKGRKLQEKIHLTIQVETAIGLMNLREICRNGAELSLQSNTFKLDGLVFGSDDFCADIGATRTQDAKELLYARQKIVTTAKAFGLQHAIDMTYIDYKDLEGLRLQSEEGARMGFTGKQVIHPDQIPIVQKAFSPSPERIEWATELVKSFDEHQASGRGAFTFRGNMIDMPLLLQARNVLYLATAAEHT